jgi:hypothetical protein
MRLDLRKPVEFLITGHELRRVLELAVKEAGLSGFRDGVLAAADDPSGVRLMGAYERGNLGLGDFDDSVGVVLAGMRKALMELSYDDAAEAESRIEEAGALAWSAYVSSFNDGVRILVPNALEAGED